MARRAAPSTLATTARSHLPRTTIKDETHSENEADNADTLGPPENARELKPRVQHAGDRNVTAGSIVNSTIHTGDTIYQQSPEQTATVQELLALAQKSEAAKAASGKIALLAEQFRDGYLTPVREQAEKFQLPPDLPLQDKHRFFTVVSGAYIFSGEPARAVEAIEKSLQEDPENLQVRENAANVYLIAGHLERAHNHATGVLEKTRSTTAFVVLVQTSFERAGRAAVDELLDRNAWALTDQAVQVAVAVTYLKEGKLDEAEGWLRRDVPSEIRALHNVQHLQFLAEVLIERAQTHLSKTLPLARPQDATSLALLTKALEYCQTLIDYLQHRDLKEAYARALALRGTARLLSGDSQTGLGDLDRAYALGDSSDLVRLSRARCLLDLDRTDEIIAFFEAVPPEARPKGYDGLLAAAHYRKRRYARAVASFKRELPKTESQGERLATLSGLLDCYVKLHDTAAAEETCAILSAEGADDPPALASVASYLYYKGETDRAHALFRELTQDNPQGVVCLEYADLLASEERWQDAADLLEPFVDESAPTWLFERYAVAAFYAKAYARALDLIERSGVSLEASPMLSQIELELRLKAYDFARAIPLAKALMELGSTRDVRPLLIQAQIGQGDYEAAKAEIEQLDPVTFNEAPETLIWLARLAQALKIPQALELAWEAVRAAPDDHDIFADYFSICVSDRTLQEVGVTALDITVTLRLASGEELNKTLLARYDLKAGEVNVNTPTGQALLGKRVGDTIPWGHNLAGIQYAEVVQVRSKHVARLQDTNPSNLPTELPPRLMRVEATPENIQQLVERLRPQNDAVDELLRAYGNQPTFPIHGLVVALEEPLPQIRSRLRDKGIALKSFEGGGIFVPGRTHPYRGVWTTVDVLRYRRSQCHTKVVMDETGLLTLAELDQLNLLAKRFDEVFVPRSLLLSFEDFLLRQSDEMRASQIPGECEAVKKVVAWVRAHAKIVPSYPRLRWQREVEPNLSDIVTPHVLDVLLTAEENDLLLFADDVGLARLWSGQARRPTTNTRHLFNDALVGGHLSPLEYTKLLVKLAEAGHGFVAVNAMHLILLFEEAGVSQSFTILAGQLGKPNVEPKSAAHVALEFFNYLLRDQARLLVERTDAVCCVLDALAHKGDAETLAHWLEGTFETSSPQLAFSAFLFRKQVRLWLHRVKQRENPPGDPASGSL